MARIFITGSADGLGLMAGKLLVAQGHDVVLHARSDQRAGDARSSLPQATDVVVGDLSFLEGMHEVAEGANASGPFDAVIHNAGIGYRDTPRRVTVDGVTEMFAVNVLAPYVLSARIVMPRRLVYLSSGLHRSGQADLEDLQWAHRSWNGLQAYSDTKLYDSVLAAAVARHRPDVVASSVEPGWVATKMGGPEAPDDLALGAVTQAWLAVSDDPAALVSGGYFYHQQLRETHPGVDDRDFQETLLATCAELSGVALPRSAVSS